MTPTADRVLYRKIPNGEISSIPDLSDGYEVESRRVAASCVFSIPGQTQLEVRPREAPAISLIGLPLTSGPWPARKIDRVVLDWPQRPAEEYKDLHAGKTYNCIEKRG